jgi:hypothetical protein
MEDLLIAIVRSSGPIDEDELVRCAEWCADVECSHVLVQLVREGKAGMHWPEGAREPMFYQPGGPIRPAETGGAVTVRELPEEFAVLVHRAERNAAERDGALDLLAQLVAIVRREGGYMLPEDQATLRAARALLAEHGRAVP